MVCAKVQFTVLNRRHHCRNCGLVICGNCSKQKFLIPSISSKPVRVCDKCFADLCQRRVSSPGNIAAAGGPEQSDEHEIRNGGNGAADVASAPSVPDCEVGHENGATGESSDSDEDLTDALEHAAANLSVEDEKPIFYSEVEQVVPPAPQ